MRGPRLRTLACGRRRMRVQWTDGHHVSEADDWPKDARYVFVDLDVRDRAETERTARRLFLPHPMAMNRLLEDSEARAGVQLYPDVMAATVLADLEGGPRKPLHLVLGQHFLL